jgi:hypothetical protein
MVLHHRRLRERRWRVNMLINGFGAVLTATALVIAVITKFVHGAWLTVLLISSLVVLFFLVSRHYRAVGRQLKLASAKLQPFRQIVLVPLADLNRASARALAYAHSISRQVNAIYVAPNEEEAQELREKLKKFDPEVKLIVVESPYRALTQPLLSYLDALHEEDKTAFITVVVPEFIIAHWWERLLHNGTAERIHRALEGRTNVAVVDVPYKLG